MSKKGFSKGGWYSNRKCAVVVAIALVVSWFMTFVEGVYATWIELHIGMLTITVLIMLKTLYGGTYD